MSGDAATARVRRLGPGDTQVARRMFELMAAVFEEDSEPLDDAYVEDLLGRPGFWAMAAFIDTEVVGGLTAHALPMTRSACTELFIYDLAVRAEDQRRGIASLIVNELRSQAELAGMTDVFVPADDDDLHALAFYRALGASDAAVTMFTFAVPEGPVDGSIA